MLYFSRAIPGFRYRFEVGIILYVIMYPINIIVPFYMYLGLGTVDFIFRGAPNAL
jgi:hypothetical protein